ncbi:MAG: BrnA antitoxin family protein [Spirochaetaceae bacterium]|nr:BrnA antitoxin family protein [Spirochaetaceae bacterium]
MIKKVCVGIGSELYSIIDFTAESLGLNLNKFALSSLMAKSSSLNELEINMKEVKMEKKLKTITLRLPEEVYTNYKIEAFRRAITFSDLVTAVLLQRLKEIDNTGNKE